MDQKIKQRFHRTTSLKNGQSAVSISFFSFRILLKYKQKVHNLTDKQKNEAVESSRAFSTIIFSDMRKFLIMKKQNDLV